jgi:ABC-2 type transport system permease protein
MYSIFKKELAHFFSSLMGYIIIGVFLLANGVFVWLFPDTSVLEYGYASLTPLFENAPMILLFLIPALTMRMFAEEKKNGTIELLSTRPLSPYQIIMGKFFAAIFIYIMALLPTLFYYFSIYQLANPIGNIDNGALMGSYIGLLLLGSCFAAIGLFASSVTSNQVVAFIIAISLCFCFYQGFDFASKIAGIFGKFDYEVQQLGINAHYAAVSYGVLDSRDILYFLTVIFIFISFTKTSLQSNKW